MPPFAGDFHARLEILDAAKIGKNPETCKDFGKKFHI